MLIKLKFLEWIKLAFSYLELCLNIQANVLFNICCSSQQKKQQKTSVILYITLTPLQWQSFCVRNVHTSVITTIVYNVFPVEVGIMKASINSKDNVVFKSVRYITVIWNIIHPINTQTFVYCRQCSWTQRDLEHAYTYRFMSRYGTVYNYCTWILHRPFVHRRVSFSVM